MGNNKPTLQDNETLANYFNRLDEWKQDGDWTPACNGTEVPFNTKSGSRLLYVYQARTGNHAYLDMGTDMVIPDNELHLYGMGA